MSTNTTTRRSTTTLVGSPPVGSATDADRIRSMDIEVLFDLAGIGFELIHEAAGSCCEGCPAGLDLAA
jgi:hypothetical protein